MIAVIIELVRRGKDEDRSPSEVIIANNAEATGTATHSSPLIVSAALGATDFITEQRD